MLCSAALIPQLSSRSPHPAGLTPQFRHSARRGSRCCCGPWLNSPTLTDSNLSTPRPTLRPPLRPPLQPTLRPTDRSHETNRRPGHTAHAWIRLAHASRPSLQPDAPHVRPLAPPPLAPLPLASLPLASLPLALAPLPLRWLRFPPILSDGPCRPPLLPMHPRPLLNRWGQIARRPRQRCRRDIHPPVAEARRKMRAICNCWEAECTAKGWRV